VVIDVVRAFTTAAWAFHLGAERIVLTDDLAGALRLKAQLPRSLALKDGEPEPGFDLTNSPVHMKARTDLRGRTIVQRTTHGTIGAVAARGATVLFCASFVCASATASIIRDSGETDVWFVVTGAGGKAEEDLACAEFIAALIEDRHAATLRIASELPAAERVVLAIRRQRFDAGDVAMCMAVDRFDFVMRAKMEDGLLVLRKVAVEEGGRWSPKRHI
jgi:2-phosphosulfolactate phosphatase